ncbi:MAG: universal stress protein [Gudongella sp.]|jgi:nucleotide-binding universal stress UspA family protein|nr:universal stress protein [Gudongella sp.]
MRKIIVPIDGSPTSQKAAEVAIDVAKKYDGSLVFLTVARRPEVIGTGSSGYGGVYNLDLLTEELKKHQEKILDDSIEKLDLSGIESEKRVEVGTPSEEIVDLAEKLKADLIVIGRRGYSRVKRFFVGSVSQRVVSEAHCPVLVVNDDEA